MPDWFFALIIVFLASVLQSTIGFGFAIMATPFLLLVFESRDCIQISILLSFLIAITLLPKIVKEIDCSLLKRLLIGSVLGVPIGLLFFKFMSINYLKLTVSIVISILSLFLLLKWYQTYYNNSFRKTENTSKNNNTLPQGSKKMEILLGLLAGIFTTSIGMPGAPLALYFNWANTKKEITRSTTLAFFVVVYIYSILSQALTMKISSNVLLSSARLSPSVILGVIIGNLIFSKINQKIFYFIANIILFCTGLYMLQSIF